MKVLLKEINLLNFKNHKSLALELDEITRITGMNGEGKTTIGEVATFVLYGCDLLGKKLDPEPLNYAYDRVFASILLSIDGIDILLAREIEGSSNNFYKNDIPVKAKEYEAFVAQLFEKEMFLSLYNPSFFFSMHWEKQRSMIMKYVSAPLNADIFSAMSGGKELNPYAKRLETELKKETIPNLQAKHTKNKNDKDKLYTQAQGSVKTITEQIKAFKDVPDVDLVRLAADDAELVNQRNEIEKVTDSAGDINASRSSLVGRINSTKEQIAHLASLWPTLRDEQVIDTCRTCKQALPEEAKAAVVADKEKRIEAFKANHAGLVSKRKLLEAELEGIDPIDVSAQRELLREIEVKRDVIAESVRQQKQKDALSGQLEAAKKLEAEYLASNKDSIFVLDAIKSFNATEASLQVSKVEALFTRLKVRLFNHIESTGEYKPFFMIQMDGKDYSYLSLGESVTAGLELHEVLHKQSGLIVPCFLDNIESYTGAIKVYGQAIISRVVEGQALQINGEGAV